MNPIDQEFAMIFNNSSYRIINQNNLELLDVYYDSIINPLSILPNNINFTHLNDIYVNSSEEPINISPITISDNLNNSIIDDVSIFINRNESTDDLFNLINNWINSISINNNIYVNYLEQTEPESIKVNMSQEEFFKMIKNVNYSNEMSNKQCSICTFNFEIGDNIKTTPCNHFFHMNCIYNWLTKHCIHPLCPICRHDCREIFINKKKKKKRKKKNRIINS